MRVIRRKVSHCHRYLPGSYPSHRQPWGLSEWSDWIRQPAFRATKPNSDWSARTCWKFGSCIDSTCSFEWYWIHICLWCREDRQFCSVDRLDTFDTPFGLWVAKMSGTLFWGWVDTLLEVAHSRSCRESTCWRCSDLSGIVCSSCRWWSKSCRSRQECRPGR